MLILYMKKKSLLNSKLFFFEENNYKIKINGVKNNWFTLSVLLEYLALCI